MADSPGCAIAGLSGFCLCMGKRLPASALRGQWVYPDDFLLSILFLVQGLKLQSPEADQDHAHGDGGPHPED